MPKRRIYKRDSRGRFATTSGGPSPTKAANQPEHEKIPRWRITGKTMTLYHRTSPEAAEKIEATGFNNVPVFASTRGDSGAANVSYGSSVVKFRVPRKAVAYEESAPQGETWVSTQPTSIINRGRRRK